MIEYLLRWLTTQEPRLLAVVAILLVYIASMWFSLKKEASNTGSQVELVLITSRLERIEGLLNNIYFSPESLSTRQPPSSTFLEPKLESEIKDIQTFIPSTIEPKPEWSRPEPKVSIESISEMARKAGRIK